MKDRHTPTEPREEIESGPSREKRYIRRDERGHFTEDQVDEGHSLSLDRQRDAKHRAPRGQGDRGDRNSDEL